MIFLSGCSKCSNTTDIYDGKEKIRCCLSQTIFHCENKKPAQN